jgi:hypothetical protein
MNHPSPAEIHDHVYGFKSCLHVEGCPECLRAAEAIKAERDALKEALSGEQPEAPYELVVKLSIRKPRAATPATKATVSIAGLAAAVAFLAGLSWLLFYKPSATTAPTPADSGNPTRKGDIDRLIEELKGSSPLRREIAGIALRAYRFPVLERLVKAGIDPALIDIVMGATAENREILHSLRIRKIDLDFEGVELTPILEFIREHTKLNFVLDAGVTDMRRDEAKITLKARGVTVGTALKLIFSQERPGHRHYVVHDGTVIITRQNPTRAPVRVIARSDADKWALTLESPLKEKHDEAAGVLRDLGFAAEPALWGPWTAPTPACASAPPNSSGGSTPRTLTRSPSPWN